MTDISNVEIPVVNPDAKPLSSNDLKIMAHIAELAIGSCYRKCPQGKTWDEWLEFQRHNLLGFWAPDPDEFQKQHPDPLPDDHGDCFMNCLSKYSVWHDYVRRKFNVEDRVMPRVILRIDEKIEPYGLLHPKRWNMFRGYWTRKEFLPNHLKERPFEETDIPLMPSEEEALRKKEEELALKEAVKEEMFVQHLAGASSANEGDDGDDEYSDKEFEALKETKLNQLFTKIRTKQVQEDQQKANKK